MDRTALPVGAVTFLFTDIEGSTRLWEQFPEYMRTALARHDNILHETITSHGGHVVKTTGDGCHAVFASPLAAVLAVVAAERRLLPTRVATPQRSSETSEVRELWDQELRIRAGLHSGEAELRDGDYYGSAVNRAARLMSIGHGGQMLLSAATAALVADSLPPGLALRELGEHRLRDLSRPETVYQLLADDLPADFPPLRSLDALPGNLPVQLTSFVGRERELAEVKGLLATTRLLTLTGPGGTGKTRLSLQAAADVQRDYRHGAWLVEFAPLTDPALVPDAVATLFNLSPIPGVSTSDVLRDYLRGKEMLLILDNCEHLVAACARLAADLTVVAPRLTILASSREGLGVPGETTYHVPTLALPSTADTTAAAVCRFDAADLFLQRAQAAKPGFAMSDANAAAVARIVRRLDGIPLAIELAAARVRLLSPEQIADRLNDRFRLLTGGSRTALPRQQTLRALIDWSYDLLDARDQWFFRQLGVFVGGWSLEAAEAVATAPDPDLSGFGNLTGLDPLDLLDGLVNKSLVMVDEVADQPRYRYLETIRQYARDKLFELGEGEAARDRHLAFYRRIVEAVEPLQWEGAARSLLAFSFHTLGPLQVVIEHDLENLRAAIEWGIGRDPEQALSMATKLALALTMSRSGGPELVGEALAAVAALPAVEGPAALDRARLLCLSHLAMGFSLMGVGETVPARTHLGEAVRLARESEEPGYLAAALTQRSLAGTILNADDTVADGLEAGEIYRAINAPMGQVQALGQIAEYFFRRGEFDRARLPAESALAVARSYVGDDPSVNAISYMVLPRLARFLGDFPLAEAQFRTGVEALRRLQVRFFAAVLESELAHMLRETGRPADARPVYREVIREWQDLGRRAAVANILECFAFMARAEAQPEHAARLLGAAEAIRDEIRVDMTPWEREEYDREVAALRAMLPPTMFEAAWSAGRAMTLDAAVDLAVSD